MNDDYNLVQIGPGSVRRMGTLLGRINPGSLFPKGLEAECNKAADKGNTLVLLINQNGITKAERIIQSDPYPGTKIGEEVERLACCYGGAEKAVFALSKSQLAECNEDRDFSLTEASLELTT